MNAKTIQIGSDLRAGSREAGGLHAWAGRRLESLRRYQQRRLAIRELSRMSDWRLQDMGIPRDRIPEVVDGLIERDGPVVTISAR